MVNDSDRDGISQVTFLGGMAQIFGSMSILLGAVGRPEDSWYRAFVQVYLALMVVLYTGGMIWLLWWRRAARKGSAGGGPGGQS